MDLEYWVNNPDDAYQYHETRGEKADNEFQRILKIKGANECVDPK
jgi:hypothetical protein